MNQQFEERKESKQSQVLTRRHTGLVVVWIGLDPGLDRPRPRIGPTFLCMLHLGCSVTRKGRQGEQAASGQLGCLTAWMCNSCSLTAWQRGLATHAAWQRGFTTVCRLLGRVNNCRHQLAHICYHSKGLDQRSGSTPLERSGSGVWIRGLDRLWDRGLIQTLHFEPQPYSHS